MWRFLRNRRLILRLHTIFTALIYWAHRAVIFAIAQFSCLLIYLSRVVRDFYLIRNEMKINEMYMNEYNEKLKIEISQESEATDLNSDIFYSLPYMQKIKDY